MEQAAVKCYIRKILKAWMKKVKKGVGDKAETPGGYSHLIWEEVCRPYCQTLTLFMTKNGYFDTLFMT